MSKRFNLLLLHRPEDIHPRTWICLRKPKLKTIVKNIEKDILKNQGWHREKLSKEIANRLHCSHTTIKWVLLGKREFYPVPIIFKLLRFSKNKRKFLKEIKKNIRDLKVNSASAKPVKAVYKLSENSAKILGAFMADGSLSIQVMIAAPYSKNLEKIKKKLTKLKIHYSTGNASSRNQHYISIQANGNNFELLNKIIPYIDEFEKLNGSSDINDFNISDKEVLEFRKKYKLEGKPIVYLGNCQKAKGVVESYNALKCLNCHLVTSGKPMVEIPARNFEVSSREYLRLLKTSDIVLTMSKFKEGWCRTAHEAMLCKTPVIGSGKGGMRELLEGGKQIICEDFSKLRERVECLLRNPQLREKMGEDGYNFARSFTIEKFKKDWLKLIKDLL